MPLFMNASDFTAALTPGRLLGLDIGAQKIGMALSDTERRIATPLDILLRENMSKDTGRLRTVLREHQVVGIIAGLPKTPDGNENEHCAAVRHFLEKLDAKITLPILLQDERFSTSAAARAMNESGMTRKKRDANDDKVAAGIILQAGLDKLG
jgi:putative Holliday junction resolvase